MTIAEVLDEIQYARQHSSERGHDAIWSLVERLASATLEAFRSAAERDVPRSPTPPTAEPGDVDPAQEADARRAAEFAEAGRRVAEVSPGVRPHAFNRQYAVGDLVAAEWDQLGGRTELVGEVMRVDPVRADGRLPIRIMIARSNTFPEGQEIELVFGPEVTIRRIPRPAPATEVVQARLERRLEELGARTGLLSDPAVAAEAARLRNQLATLDVSDDRVNALVAGEWFKVYDPTRDEQEAKMRLPRMAVALAREVRRWRDKPPAPGRRRIAVRDEFATPALSERGTDRLEHITNAFGALLDVIDDNVAAVRSLRYILPLLKQALFWCGEAISEFAENREAE